MKALVTGGAGFIGSNLVKTLLKKGDNVIVLDDFSSGNIENLIDIADNINFKIIEGSVCDIKLVQKLVSENDIVYHLAAKCLVECNENPTIANETNVTGTFNICLAASNYHKKVVHISSSEVYGTCKFSPMTENHPTEPQSIYGLSKLMGEEYVKFFNKYYNLPAVIIRPFNSYGQNHRNDQYSAVITAFIRQLENNKYPIIEWTGEQSRDFTYVSDTVDGIITLSKLENGEIVNIGNGESVTIKELAMTLLRIYGIENEFRKLKYVNKRQNDVFKLEAGTEIANSYGYKPKISLEKGLRKYISWWRKNVK